LAIDRLEKVRGKIKNVEEELREHQVGSLNKRDRWEKENTKSVHH
jgi:hypothetical protein